MSELGEPADGGAAQQLSARAVGLRLLAALVALCAGVAALTIAILLVKSTLG